MSLTLRYGAATSAGRMRALNEDSLLCGPRVFAVADGVGGQAAGEVASTIAMSRLGEIAHNNDLRIDDVLKAIERANDDILGNAALQDQRRGMATTLTGLALVCVGGLDHWLVFNVGDSRVYHLAGGRLAVVTIDHSEAQELQDAGLLSAAEARTYAGRNVITRSLGTQPGTEADVWVLPAVAGERFLACSDGLDIELTSEEIAEVLCAEGVPQRAADRLVGAALDAGGRDNVTVVVVDVLAGAPADEAQEESAETTVPRATLLTSPE